MPSAGRTVGSKRQPRSSVAWLVAAAFIAFAAACGTRPSAYPIVSSAPLVARGEKVYAQNCATCHGSQSDQRDVRAVPPPHNSNGHTWHHPDPQLIDIVLNGFDSSRPDGLKMPAFKDKLSDEDARAAVAFIKTWWTPEQRGWQATVTAQSLELDREQKAK